VSWTELQSSNEKHVIPLGGVRISYTVRCECFSISLYRVEYQEDWCWINRRGFGRKRLFANRGVFRYLRIKIIQVIKKLQYNRCSERDSNQAPPNTSLDNHMCSGTQEIPLISRNPEVR